MVKSSKNKIESLKDTSLGWKSQPQLPEKMFSISQEAQATVVLTDSFASWGTFPRGFNPEGRPVTSTVNALEHPVNWWCHPTILSSAVPFSCCLQSFPESWSFPVSQFFASGGQSIGVSASASVLPMNTQDWSPLGWTGWISSQSKGLSRIFSNNTVQKHH